MHRSMVGAQSWIGPLFVTTTSANVDSQQVQQLIRQIHRFCLQEVQYVTEELW